MGDTTLAEIAAPFLPDEPTFDLTSEPWIDVADPDGTNPRRVGLHEALVCAHDLRLDDSARGPLWTHAITRLLVAMTYLVRAAGPDASWDDVAAGRTGLPTAHIDAMLYRLSDHLWLHHPDTPFLQAPTALHTMREKAHHDPTTELDRATDPFWTLLPDVPSKSNTAWFGRAEDQSPPDAADAAAALLVRHYFALPGNEKPNPAVGNGRRALRSEGGATGLTHHGRSFAMIAGPTLATVLVRNLLHEWVRNISPTTPTFIEAPAAVNANIAPSPNPLWTYTASCAATVLIPALHDPGRYRVVRTPAPIPNAMAKTVSELAAMSDPHALRVEAKTPGEPHSHVRLSTDGSDLDLVRQYFRDLATTGSLKGPSVLIPRALAHHPPHGREVDVLVIKGAGGATGPRIGATATYRPPAGVMELDLERVRWYLHWADLFLGGRGKAATLVGTHALNAMSPAGNEPETRRRAIHTSARQALAVAIEDVLRDLLKTASDPTATMPTDLPATHRSHVRNAALATYDALVEPHRHRPAAVPNVVIHRRRLRARLDTLLEANA